MYAVYADGIHGQYIKDRVGGHCLEDFIQGIDTEKDFEERTDAGYGKHGDGKGQEKALSEAIRVYLLHAGLRRLSVCLNICQIT